MEKGNSGNPLESSHYWDNVKNLVSPFITADDEIDRGFAAENIARILDRGENSMLNMLRLNNESSFAFSRLIKDVRGLLKAKRISKDAPWLKALENKMVTLELYAASTDHEMDIEQGRENRKKEIDKVIKEVEKDLGIERDSDDSPKK
ncbi:hypothetical protein HYZ82_03180 [Candidatus Nomurabacteria bacterium]|nr:hypothetical protein [Candidatus Nomurabacteria bacterium]